MSYPYHILSLRFLAPFVSVLFFLVGLSANAKSEQEQTFPWIVSPNNAAEIIESEKPTILDTRSSKRFDKNHIPGSRHIDWSDFTPAQKSRRGQLLEDISSLETKLQKLGVSNDRPVLVIGNPPKNWGEDGRIVWMLRIFGHEKTALVDGGFSALMEQKPDIEKSDRTDTAKFETKRTERWQIDRGELRDLIEKGDKQTVVVDTRSSTEYHGKTPYGEKRAGHIPGAKHLHYKTLLDENGYLRPENKLREILKRKGIVESKRIVTYCTGGVRSGWLTVVLHHLGYPNVQNYAGSAWHWTSGDAEKYPLDTNGEGRGEPGEE